MNKPAYIPETIGRTPTPGSLLAERRKEYGWSITDVARALRLSESQVRAIEADDYANLPGKTYVMGYWRSYSHLLRISIDESIQIHRADLSGKLAGYTLEMVNNEAPGTEETSRKRAAVLFALLLVAVLAAIWYWQNPDVSVSHWIDDGMRSLRTAAAPSPEPLGQIETASVVEEQAAEVIEPSGTTAEEVAAAGELVLPEPTITDSVLALPVPNFAEGEESVEINTLGYSVLISNLPLSRRDLIYQQPEIEEAEKKSARQEVAKSQPKKVEVKKEPEAPAQPQQNTSTETPAAASSGNQRIVFNVAKESWIDVRDSTGERLIYRTVNRGEDISLRGKPPYSVFIGSAEGVRVQYQGKPVEFKVHESGLFARFEVGR